MKTKKMLAHVRKENLSLYDVLDEQRERIRTLEEQLSEFGSTDRQEMRQRIEDLTADRMSLSAEVKRLNGERAGNMQQITRLANELRDAKRGGAQGYVSSALASSWLEAKDRRNIELSNEIGRLKEEVDRARNVANLARKRCKTLRFRLDSSRKLVDAFDNRLAVAEKRAKVAADSRDEKQIAIERGLEAIRFVNAKLRSAEEALEKEEIPF